MNVSNFVFCILPGNNLCSHSKLSLLTEVGIQMMYPETGIYPLSFLILSVNSYISVPGGERIVPNSNVSFLVIIFLFLMFVIQSDEIQYKLFVD